MQTNRFVRRAHEFRLRLCPHPHPTLIAELLFELLHQRLFVAIICHAVGIRLGIVTNIAGVNPVEENTVDVISQDFLQGTSICFTRLWDTDYCQIRNLREGRGLFRSGVRSSYGSRLNESFSIRLAREDDIPSLEVFILYGCDTPKLASA